MIIERLTSPDAKLERKLNLLYEKTVMNSLQWRLG